MNGTPDKISELFQMMPKGTFASEDELRNYVSDDVKLKEVYSFFPRGYFKDEKEYSDYFADSVKKKPTQSPFQQNWVESVQSQKPLKTSSTQQQQLPSEGLKTPDLTLKVPETKYPQTTPGILTANYIAGKKIPRAKPSDEAKTVGEWLTAIPGELDRATANLIDKVAWLYETPQNAVAQLFLGRKGVNEYMKLKKEGVISIPGEMPNRIEMLQAKAL